MVLIHLNTAEFFFLATRPVRLSDSNRGFVPLLTGIRCVSIYDTCLRSVVNMCLAPNASEWKSALHNTISNMYITNILTVPNEC
jgi:hypothetical protein